MNWSSKTSLVFSDEKITSPVESLVTLNQKDGSSPPTTVNHIPINEEGILTYS